MPHKWKTVRIFISSTFRDMHAERDHLVRFVFPELKEKCRKKRVHLIDVDLRWGVTEADAQDGKALDICLDEIDFCRPYFLGLLGHRYGWTPPGQEHSITAQEIYHGVLHNDVPRQVVDLRQIIDCRLEGKTLNGEQIDCLVRCYHWEADKGKYLLNEDASPDDLNIIRSIFHNYSAYQKDRSFFFFLSESLTKELAGQNTNDFFEPDDVGNDKLTSLKQEIIDAGQPFFDYDDIETFGRNVGDILWKRINAELDQTVPEEKSWIEEEDDLHELFMADRTRRFVGRRDFLDRMNVFCKGNAESSMMVVTGEPGWGKSALMARFTEETIHNHPDWLIIPHFVGSSPSSTNLRQTLKRFCTFLNQASDSPEEIPEDIKELIQVFPDLMAKASKGRKILFIVDAVNQLEKADNAHHMHWLPQQLPENMKFVISTLAGDPLDALMVRRIRSNVETVTGLNEGDIKELVADYLAEIRREFPNKEVEETFFKKVKAGNPLYIQVALEELRVFGKFEELARRVIELPDNIPELFVQVLERIETDFNPDIVRDCMTYIACGRHGMTAEELQTLLRTHAPYTESDTLPEKLPDMLWARLFRSFSAFLFERSGVIDFFHGQLRESVGQRYLHEETDRNATHKTIADYFENQIMGRRTAEELVWQLKRWNKWRDESLSKYLTNLIETKLIEGKVSSEFILEQISNDDWYPAMIQLSSRMKESAKFIEIIGGMIKDINQSSKINTNYKIVGIGGAGLKVLDILKQNGGSGKCLFAIDWERYSLDRFQECDSFLLPMGRLRYFGWGGVHHGGSEYHRTLVLGSIKKIAKRLQGIEKIVIVMGLGGSTGSGVSPVIAAILKKMKTNIVVFATSPFSLEGKGREKEADDCKALLENFADLIDVTPADELIRSNRNITLKRAYSLLDEFLFEKTRNWIRDNSLFSCIKTGPG